MLYKYVAYDEANQKLEAESLEVIKQDIKKLGGKWGIYELKYTAEPSVVVTEVRPVHRGAVSALDALTKVK